jgi:tetratricopeptide (TPR) repeat protein
MRVSGRALAWCAGLVLWIAGIAWCQEASGADAVLRHAVQLHQSGDTAAAIAEYRRYLEQVPDNVMARSNLGAALAHSGQFEEAIVEYRKALEAQPGNLPVRLNLALAYYKAAEISQAATELERVLEQQHDRQPVLLLADCYLRLGENKKVIDLLAPLQQGTPDDKALDYLLGTALIRDGQAAPGQMLVDRIVRDGDSAEGRLLMGESKLIANDFPGALEEFKKGLAINPQLPGLNGYYGIALAYAGDLPGAEAAYRKELASNPNDYSANFQLGKLLKGDENYTESRRCFERALGLRPHDPPARYQLALLDLEDGQADQARAKLENLIRENPRDVEAHISLATAYYRLKRKADGNQQRAIVLQLNAERQAAASGGMPK